MNSLARAIIFFLGLIYIVVPYGSRWDSINNPTKNVTVNFRDGTEFNGTLWTDWQGMQNLQQSDGKVLIFSQDSKNLSSMSFKMPEPDRQESTFFKHWRSFLPLSIWGALFLIPALIDFTNLLNSIGSSRRTNTDAN